MPNYNSINNYQLLDLKNGSSRDGRRGGLPRLALHAPYTFLARSISRLLLRSTVFNFPQRLHPLPLPVTRN